MMDQHHPRERAGAQRPIRWLTFTEEADPTPWLRGGELLVTTGLALKDEEDLRFISPRLDTLIAEAAA